MLQESKLNSRHCLESQFKAFQGNLRIFQVNKLIQGNSKLINAMKVNSRLSKMIQGKVIHVRVNRENLLNM